MIQTMAYELTDEEKKRLEIALRASLRASEGDGPTHDPTDQPVKVPWSADAEAIIRSILPSMDEKEDRIVVLSIRSTNPKTILGAKPSAACQVCKELVWVAPSTRSLLERLYSFAKFASRVDSRNMRRAERDQPVLPVQEGIQLPENAPTFLLPSVCAPRQ